MTVARSTTTLTVSAPSSATRAKSLTVTGKVANAAALPAGTALTVKRTDLESPSGKALATVKTKADGAFSFTDTSSAGGDVKYTVSYAGDASRAAASGSDTVAVSRTTPTLSLNNNGTVYSYDKDVTFTAHLGTTYKNRTVEIWANPFGSTGKVSASSPTYYWYRKTTGPLFTTRMSYYPGRRHRLDIDVYSQGQWHRGYEEFFGLGTNGKSVIDLGSSDEAGLRVRVRSAYINESSGDNVNSTTYSSWKYLYFTN